jgi:hypothetical protein
MVNISTTVRGHYGNDVYLWAIIIRRFCDSPQDILLVPGFIPLVQHVDQHTLIVTVSNSQPLHLKHLLIPFLRHLLQTLLGRISLSSHFGQLSP